MKIKLLILFFGCLLITSNAIAGKSHFLEPELKLGKHAVGYQRLSVTDYSATAKPRFDFKGNQVETQHLRQIPISFWYPAKANTGSPQTVTDYVHAYAPGKLTEAISEQDKTDAIANFNGYPLQQGASQADLDKLLSTAVIARANAEQANGRYPLILIPGGFYANFFVTPTAEYFASHGFTVAYINDALSTGIAGYANENDSLWRLSDLKQAINRLAQEPNVQWNNIGIWAYHSGGSVGALLQMQSDNVRGLVSIEGSEGWTRESTGYPLLSQVSLFDPDRVKVPYMRFQSMNPGPDWYISTPAKTTWEFYDQVKFADVTKVILSDSEHDDISDGVRDKVIPGKKDRRNNEQRLYLTYGLNFFEATLNGNKQAKTKLKKQPKSFGFDENFAKLTTQNRKAAPPQKSDLRRIYEHEGIASMETLVKQNLSSDDPTITTRLLGSLAQDYVWAEKNNEAGLEIVDVAIRLFPKDFWGPYLAGFIHNRLKDKANKVKFYQLAKQRLVADNTIDADEKNRRLDRINSALKEEGIE